MNEPVAVLLSGGLDSAVLLAMAERRGPVQPIYVAAGLAWEGAEMATVEALMRTYRDSDRVRPVVRLRVDMRDVYPASHWAVRGEAPGFDTPDEDVYIEGRNIILLSKAAVFMARAKISRVAIGPLAGNPFPDASRTFFDAMQQALSIGLDWPIAIEAPLAAMHKADVIITGAELGVPFELTLSCMQPQDGLHCGRCSKCRERRDGFTDAGVTDPTDYATVPLR